MCLSWALQKRLNKVLITKLSRFFYFLQANYRQTSYFHETINRPHLSFHYCFNAEARGKWQQIGLDFNARIIHTHANAPQLNSHYKVTSSSSIDGCFGFGITVYNVYADIVYKPRKYSKDISVKKWNDTRELLAHIGYRIPIQKFYVTPLIGFIRTQFGKTDGSDWTINSNGIHNSFHAHTTKVEFDAGAKVGYKGNTTLWLLI